MWPFGKSAKDRLVEALREQDLTKALDLDVSVSKKTAKVSGSVPNERYKNLITAVANGINGIANVDLSGLVVAPAAAADSSGQPSGTGVVDAIKDAAGKVAASVAGAAASPSLSSPADLDQPSRLAKAVLVHIANEPSLANNPIDVLQRGSTIVLRGAVDSEAELEKAKELARSVEGVTDVDVAGLGVIDNASSLNVTNDEGDIVYTVKSGDTLSHIALHYYGSAGAKSYMKIAEANGISDANKIRVGQELKIPGTITGPENVLG